MSNNLCIPDEPLKIALIGAGARLQSIYGPLFPALKPWVEVTAVCDTVPEIANAMAESLDVPAFYDLRELVKSGAMEAAIVVTPIESHYPISVYLSSHGIHNLIETTWTSMLCQAKEMVRVARENKVIVRVAENFFRFPIDRFAQTVRDSGYLGSIRRILSYADHTGYHNNSRWIAFAGNHPEWVQCIEHTMDVPAYYSMPHRRHTQEKQSARFFGFPDDFLVTDIGSGNVKGHLGRHPRPGYTEWHGERGTLVHHGKGPLGWTDVETELRLCSDAKFAEAQEASGVTSGGGIVDCVTPVVLEVVDNQWTRIYAETEQGIIEYVNQLRTNIKVGKIHIYDWYAVPILGHMTDFALEVKGLKQSEFTDEDALASEMMECGARESSLNSGTRIKLPLEVDLESDAIIRDDLRRKYGVDPLDVEGMLAMSFPRA